MVYGLNVSLHSVPTRKPRGLVTPNQVSPIHDPATKPSPELGMLRPTTAVAAIATLDHILEETLTER